MTLETREAPATSPPDEAVSSDVRRDSAAPGKHQIRFATLPSAAFGWLRAAAPALLLGVAILALWQLVTASRVIPAYDLPAPGDVLRAWLRGVGLSGASSHTTPQLLSYGLTTLMESVAGFLLGTAIAIPLGYGIARSQMLARALQPYMAAMQALPAIALAPLLTLWLGYDSPPIIALCALIVFFPMVVNTALGLRTLDRDVLDAARVAGAEGWTLFRYMEFPLALPSILAGLRVGLTLSITGAVVGEFVAGGQGLGELLIVASSQSDRSLEFATLLTLALLAAILYGVARLAERRFSYMEAM
ncbi:MAG TPA: ABC transporter permease [Ktedonobacterales bacterium]|jgi:putative riboflavin transport system permease protein|nr:ABC transporter permease [Ktedonobacterales bacterium]